MSKKAKHLSDSWMLSQRQVEPQTDGSELEDFIMEVPKIIPSVKVNSYNSKCSVTENKGKKGKKGGDASADGVTPPRGCGLHGSVAEAQASGRVGPGGEWGRSYEGAAGGSWWWRPESKKGRSMG